MFLQLYLHKRSTLQRSPLESKRGHYSFWANTPKTKIDNLYF